MAGTQSFNSINNYKYCFEQHAIKIIPEEIISSCWYVGYYLAWQSGKTVAGQEQMKFHFVKPRQLALDLHKSEHPILENILPKLERAMRFIKIDVESAVWHLELDEESSLLTTLGTMYDRYRWKRPPVGLRYLVTFLEAPAVNPRDF